MYEKKRIHSLLTYQLVDNVLIFLFCAFLMGRLINNTEYIIACVTAIPFLFLHICLDKRRWHIILDVIFFISCFVFPTNLFFLPVILYHSYRYEKFRFLMAFFLIPVIAFLDNFKLDEFLLLLLVCMTSVVFSYRTILLNDTKSRIKVLRDDSEEMVSRLKDRNKDLMDKQDYEIHLATLSERNRIAREIHDNVGHMLSRSILQIGALTTIYKEEPLREQLLSVNENLNIAMNNIRESVHDLHDDSIDLRQTIIEVTKPLKERCEVVIDYDMTGTAPRNVKYCFASITKEAMSNIIKHSDATRVLVTLREHPGLYQLYIEDNGHINKDKMKDVDITSSGIGLTNMQERVSSLKGSIRFAFEKGFSIFISIPKEQTNESSSC